MGATRVDAAPGSGGSGGVSPVMPPAAGLAGGSGPQHPGALQLGAGIGPMVPLEPLAGTEAAVPAEAPAAPADAFESSPGSANESSAAERPRARGPDEEPPGAASPFERLARRAAADGRPRLPPVGDTVDTHEEVEVPYAAMGVLASALSAGAPLRPGGRVLLGSMLLASDALGRGLPPGADGVVHAVLQRNSLAAAAELSAWLRTSGRALALAQENAMALVQRVMRESYLVGTEVLRDYAEKVQFYNEQKKKIRELLERARATRATWAAQAKAAGGDGTFVSPEPFEAKDVDPVTGEVFTPAMTAEDVERWQATDAAQKKDAPVDPVAQFDALYGESRLSAIDRELLDTMVKDKDDVVSAIFDSDNDDYICDHIDDLTAVIPRMNGAELDRYLSPIFDTLMGGNTDEDAILAITRALTPAQMLYVQSGGLDPSDLDDLGDAVWDGEVKMSPPAIAAVAFSDGGAGTTASVLTTLTNGALFGLAQGLFGGLSESEQADLRMIAEKDAIDAAEAIGVEFSGELTKDRAKGLLLQLGQASAGRKRDEDESADSAQVGAPKQLRTTEELDAYVKDLEDRLNGTGDDAQLASVDLQNQLQKQQQLMQMMSNVSKMLHDTALAIIRKVGG